MKKVLSLIAAVLLLFGLFHATAETARIAPEPVDFDALAEVIDEYGEYTDRDSVAAYLVYFGTLPCNYITQEEARDFGWEEGEDLWLSAPGYSLGGDPYPDEAGLFSAQEYLSALSPFLECDLNYQGGERGRERLIWNEFSLWYTADGIWFDELYPGDGVLTDWEALLALPESTEAPPEAKEPTIEEIYASMVEKDGHYQDLEHVVAYLVTYHRLPANYITKSEAQRLGWVASKGNLSAVAPGCSIGGDRFGNYAGILPKASYTECDIDLTGPTRNAKRVIFDSKGNIYYTEDHYQTFTRVYPAEQE